MAQTKHHESTQTTDHDKIRRWVESRGGKPATVADTTEGKETAGLLRIDLPTGASDPPLKPISWGDFFKKFDQEKLAFLYQEETSEGSQSHFCKFVQR
jgi:hypothetical protein